MAGLAGVGAGLLEGYGTVSRIQDQKRARDLQERRLESNEAYRQDRLDAAADERAYQRQRDEVADEQWQKNYGLKVANSRADNKRADARLGIAQQNANTSARNTSIRQQQAEIELAQMRRQEREAQNRRALSAAAQELEANGPTQRFRELSQRGGMDVDNMLDADWQDSLNTLKAGLQGGPVSRQAMVDAGNTFFNDRIERMVGQKTPDGKTIVRSRLADFYPGPNGDTAVMDLDVWTRDKNGKVEKYRAPATSNRRSDDEYVLQVPMEQLTGNIAATDMANRMVDKQRLADTLKQQATLNGANDPANISGNGWRKLSGNTLYNRNSGETKEIESVADETERRSKAVDFARGDLQSLEEARSPVVTDMNDNQRQQWLLKKIKYYESVLAPDGGESAPAGDDAVVIRGNPQYGDVTESDIQTTMRETGMSRAAVMERLNGS